MSKDKRRISPQDAEEIARVIKRSQHGVAVGSADVPIFELAPPKSKKPKKKD